MTDSDNTLAAERLSDFFKSRHKKGLNASNKMAKIVLGNPRRALELGPKVASAFESENPKNSFINIT